MDLNLVYKIFIEQLYKLNNYIDEFRWEFELSKNLKVASSFQASKDPSVSSGRFGFPSKDRSQYIVHTFTYISSGIMFVMHSYI